MKACTGTHNKLYFKVHFFSHLLLCGPVGTSVGARCRALRNWERSSFFNHFIAFPGSYAYSRESSIGLGAGLTAIPFTAIISPSQS